MSDLVPQAHARFAPSASKRYLECPGSLTLERGLPDEPNEHSDEGTACHEVAAWCLTEHRRAASRVGDWIVVSHDNEPERKVQFTPNMAELTQGYVDCVRLMTISHKVRIEQRLSFSEFVGLPNQFGTTDAGFFDETNGELVVVDAKFGFQPVGVERNSQLSIYALAFLGAMFKQGVAVESAEAAVAADAMGADEAFPNGDNDDDDLAG